MCGATSIIPFTGIVAIIFLTVTTGLAQSLATIGYDCEAQLQNKTISLIDIEDCDLAINVHVETSTEDIALLQLNEYETARVLQCKIEIRRVVKNCGRQSNNSVTNSTSEYIYPISRRACEIAHYQGTMKIGKLTIGDLRPFAIAARIFNVGLAGSVDSTGACIGEDYSDPYGTWNNVVVTGTVKITLQSHEAEVKLDNDTIYLSSGRQCKLSREQCIDWDGGFTFWYIPQKRSCLPNTYSILYKGNATKLRSPRETVYSVIVDGTSFSFITVGNKTSCGTTLLKTESPKLFIIEGNDLKRLEEYKIVNHTNNFDIVQYKNAQFIHVETNLQYPALDVHRNAIAHKCQRENNFLKNILPIASTHPDEFACQYMGSPGYTAVMEEYRLHIVQCMPVEVKIMPMEKCYEYNLLPILRGNQKLFLNPKTHIITKNTTERPCFPLLPVPTTPDTNTNSRQDRTWNMYTVIALVFVGVCSILVIIKIIYNRQRRLRTESDHHDLTVQFNNHQQHD